MPFRHGVSYPTVLIRLGTLDARSWQLKFYVPGPKATGLHPEDLTTAQRAFRAVLAEPGCEPMIGFATLAGPHDLNLPAGSLVLTAYHWKETVLRRCALLLPAVDGPVRRLPNHGAALAELRLAACEGEAWQRHAACPSSSTLVAYLAEDCA